MQGTLKRTLASNAQADFPVGNGTELKKVSITPADATSRVWTISQLNSAYSNLSVVAGQGLDHVSSSSYWDISPSSTSENTVVKLNWVSNPGIEDDNLDSIVLAHYNSSEAAWEEITTTSNGDPASGGISGTISSFSPFALGSKSSSNILPIDLISFSASCKDDIVDVIFSVASQQNNDYFVIERSADGKEWEEISTIKGELKSNEQKNYSISDFAPLEGLSYYKLTQVDNDGEFKTFAPISNSCYSKETNVTFLVYPVPVINKFTFEISVDDYQGSDVFYNLINMQGAVVLTDALDLNRGVNSQTIDINHLASGIYMLSVNNSKDQIPITKIIKK